jgi:hypothetical protein
MQQETLVRGDQSTDGALLLVDDSALRALYQNKNAWGLSASIDIRGCNGATIRDADKIKTFVVELCERIDMKRFGDCVVVNFGEDERVAGYSMTTRPTLSTSMSSRVSITTPALRQNLPKNSSRVENMTFITRCAPKESLCVNY